MSMIERVCRVLYRTQYNGPYQSGDEDEAWSIHEESARAVIEALMEPDEAMVEAGDAAWRAQFGGLYKNSPLRVPGIAAMFTGMLTAALNEGEGA